MCALFSVTPAFCATDKDLSDFQKAIVSLAFSILRYTASQLQAQAALSTLALVRFWRDVPTCSAKD